MEIKHGQLIGGSIASAACDVQEEKDLCLRAACRKLVMCRKKRRNEGKNEKKMEDSDTDRFLYMWFWLRSGERRKNDRDHIAARLGNHGKG